MKKVYYIISTGEGPTAQFIPVGYMMKTLQSDPGEGFIALPHGEPIEVVKDTYPKLYEALVAGNVTHFRDMRDVVPDSHSLTPKKDES